MRILFFGEDESMRQMAESLTNVESIYCDDFKESLEILKDWDKERGDELEIFVVILDFSLGIKLLDKFSKKVKKIEGLYRCVLAKSEGLKDLKAYQKTKWACDGQLMAPISLQALQDIVEDFETVYYLDELGEEEADDVELTQLESEAAKELENLDEDKEDYDTTESNRVLPDEFRQASASDQTASQEMSPPSVSGSDELAAFDDREAIFENNPTHKKIQKIFDHVFQYGKKSTPPQNNQELELPKADEDDEAALQSEVSMAESKKEEVNVEFELPDSDLDEDEKDSNSSPSEDQASKEEDSEDGLEFDLNFDEADSEEVQPPTEDAASAQEFDFEDEEDEPLQESTEELLADDGADAANTSEAETDEGGFEFDFDEQEDEGTEGLGLSEAGEEAPQTEEVSSSDSESSPGDLDFDEESDDGLSFELGGASDYSQEDSQKSEADSDEDEGFGDLDLSSESDDVDATKVATSSLKPAESEDQDQDQDEQALEQDSGENTLDKVDKTISEIVMGDISEKSESDEDATGDFDLPDNLPEELTDDMLSEESTDSQDFSVDEWSDDDLDEKSVGEETNPTVVTSSHQLKEEKSEDETPAGFELSDDDEDDFDFSAVDSGEPEENLDKTVVQQSSPIQEVKPKDEKPEKEVVAQAPKGLSAYAEDELTRLQSTIRQLREERDENHKQIQELKKENRLIEQQGLSEKAELDELKIEISILKKRHKNELEELRYQLKLADEKKQIYEERCRNYQKEFERLNQKVRIEFNQVKQREKELESQLELVTMDTEAQVQSRDSKILELKRKIDSLEFNMENASIREQKSREDKARLEERLTKIMSTLRGSIQLLEDEDEIVDPGVDNDTDDKI